MSYPDIKDLRASLLKLPKNTAATADACWIEIQNIAMQFAAWVLPGITPHQAREQVRRGEKLGPAPGSSRKTYGQIAEELKHIAGVARALREALKNISPDCLQWLGQAEASRRGDDFFSEWFWIPPSWKGRKDDPIDSNEHDEIQARQLNYLASQLDHQAFLAALRKQGPDGGRTESNRHAAKEVMISSLTELIRKRGRADRHINQIAGVILTWATRDVVGPRWGEKPHTRAKKTIRIPKVENPS